MIRPSFGSIISAVIFSYVAYSIWSMAQIFMTPKCVDEKRCIYSVLKDKPELTLYLFTSVKSVARTDAEVELVDVIKNVQYVEAWEREIELNIPQITQRNGSLYLNLVIVPSKLVESSRWSALMSNQQTSFTRIPLTQLQIPDVYIFNLMNDANNATKSEKTKVTAKPVSHLRSEVTFNIVTDPLSMPVDDIPGEIYNKLRMTKGMKYLPIIQYNFLETKLEHLKKIDGVSAKIKLKYQPIQLGKFRFLMHVEEAMRSLKKFGFTAKDIDDVKGIFAGTNLYLLSATVAIVSFHLVFDFLALKNDVSFWRSRSSMEGLSSRTLMWRAFSQIVVFLYLLDEKASMIVLAPTGIGVIIELWKVSKVLRRKKDEISENEKQTDKYDAESMKYLSYILYPLCIGGAVYSLIFQPHKSWYSWSIHSLVNGVYAFGFLFMLPQLFVNYRLKSVAALPWRSFMYKAFNTFIDDVFAFLITMPAAHRVACFRDDVIFLIYLYQRWLYPVDKTRLDETARALGEQIDDDDSKKTN